MFHFLHVKLGEKKMPKVTPEYYEKKKEMIVEAAYQVCLRKPVEAVTITDVIAETGMSMGAIYRYYEGLDEILADMVKRLRKDYDSYERVECLSKEPNLSFEEITYRACDILGEVMEEHLMDIQKINFDFGSLAVNDPGRMTKIMSGASGRSSAERIGVSVFPRMVEAAGKQGYQMKGSPEEICAFISAAFTGIEKCCILQACYGTGDLGVKIEPRQAFRTLAKSIILLFGGSINE